MGVQKYNSDSTTSKLLISILNSITKLSKTIFTKINNISFPVDQTVIQNSTNAVSGGAVFAQYSTITPNLQKVMDIGNIQSRFGGKYTFISGQSIDDTGYMFLNTYHSGQNLSSATKIGGVFGLSTNSSSNVGNTNFTIKDSGENFGVNNAGVTYLRQSSQLLSTQKNTNTNTNLETLITQQPNLISLASKNLSTLGENKVTVNEVGTLVTGNLVLGNINPTQKLSIEGGMVMTGASFQAITPTTTGYKQFIYTDDVTNTLTKKGGFGVAGRPDGRIAFFNAVNGVNGATTTNNAFGFFALESLTAAAVTAGSTDNTALGNQAMNRATNASRSIAVGHYAGRSATTVTSSILLGSGAGGDNTGSIINSTLVGNYKAGDTSLIDEEIIISNGLYSPSPVGIGFRVTKDGTTTVPMQTLNTYDQEVSGKAVVTKEVIENGYIPLNGTTTNLITGYLETVPEFKIITGDVGASEFREIGFSDEGSVVIKTEGNGNNSRMDFRSSAIESIVSEDGNVGYANLYANRFEFNSSDPTSKGISSAYDFTLNYPTNGSEDKIFPQIAYVKKGTSYSTTETKTGGTWIDGKPIYRRVLQGTVFNSISEMLFDLNSIDATLISYKNYIEDGNGNRFDNRLNDVSYNTFTDVWVKNRLEIFLFLDDNLLILENTNEERVVATNVVTKVPYLETAIYTVILEYTKTTD